MPPPSPSPLIMSRTIPLTALVLALALTVTVPLGQASFHIPADNVDVSETIEAGQYYAVRIDAAEDGRIVFSGAYEDVDAEYPVMPVLLAIDRVDQDDGDARMWAAFVYGETDDQQGLHGYVKTPVAGQGFQTYDRRASGESVSVSTPEDAGVYDVLVATSPGDGTAQANLHIPGSAEIVATETGPSFYEQSLEHAPVAFEASAFGPYATQTRAWGHGGADVPIGVDGQLFAYMGGPLNSPAYWQEPDGDVRDPTRDFVRGHSTGPWTAAFPPETYEGPTCVGGLPNCADQFRGDPPYAFGADVGLGG